MAKGKRKRGKKGKGGWSGAAELWMPLAREIVGNFAGQVMAHKSTKRSKSSGEKQDHHRKRRDVAGDVLRILAESGPRSIAQLITETGDELLPLLRALRVMREFHLVDGPGSEDEGLLQLTHAGRRTATALRRDQIECDGRKMLQG
jgi:hypothetical protein